MGYTSTFTVYDGATDQLGKDPTAAYTGTDALAAGTRHFECRDYNTLTLRAVLVSGTAPTSIEFLLETSMDEKSTAASSSTWAVKPVAVTGAGSITTQETVRAITWAVAASSDTSHEWTETISTSKFRIRAKRTGGAADTRIRIDAMLAVR